MSIRTQTEIWRRLNELRFDTAKAQETRKDYVFRCCFHKENTPSLYVNKEKGFFFCFGCGEKGSFDKLVRHLGGDVKERKKHTAEQEIHQLLETVSPQKDLKRVTYGMCLSPVTFEWRGFSPGFLGEMGCKLWEQDVSRGTIVKYIPRIHMPIEMKGIRYGYAACMVNRSNATEVETYKKILYNSGLKMSALFMGFDRLKPNREIVLVEGPVDWLRMKQYGFNVVSILGTTGWSPGKATSLLAKSPRKIFICMDGDKAGRKAGRIILNSLSKYPVPAKEIRLPEKEDPDSVRPDFWAEMIGEIKKVRK